MGLSAYAHNKNIEKVLPIFKKLVWCDKLSFKTKIPESFYYYLQKNLTNVRFDTVAGAVQKTMEDLLVEQIRNAIKKKTRIRYVVLGGELAMNIKANMRVAH